MAEQKKKILLVEDDAIIAASESMVLAGEGFEVIRALTGETAIELVRREGESIDLVLMDVDLGKGMDGTQAAREILKHRDIPVLFISSHTEQEIVERTEKITSYGYIVKDSGDVVLLASVRMAFRLHDANRALREKEATLRENEERFRLVALNSPDHIFYQDLDLRYTWVADQVSPLAAAVRDGKTDVDFFGKEEAERVIAIKRNVIATGVSARIEAHLLREDGSRTLFEGFYEPRRDAHGTIIGLTGYARDISERKRTEEALRGSEEKFRDIFENAPLGIFQSTTGGKLLSVNATALTMFGYGPGEASLDDGEVIAPMLFVHPAEREAIIRAAKASDTFVRAEVTYRRKNGSEFMANLSMRAVRDAGGGVRILEGFVEDITERRRLESIMRESEERLREITDNMMDMVIRVDTDAVFRYVSPSHEKVLGFRPGELLGTSAQDLIHPEDREEVVRRLRETLRAGIGNMTFRCRHKNGGYRWLESIGTSVRNEKGEFVGAVIGSRDITERKSAEEQLRDSLKEKEVLVKEVLHRVKNNLNLVASLLNLQADYVVAPKDAELFREARDRIVALARIHENLYRSPNLAHLDFRSYVTDIVRNLSDAYRNERVAVRVDVATFDIGLDRAIPLGLIINELVTNCLKYAFPGERNGKILVSYTSESEREGCLSVRDDGVGLPATLDIRTPGTFGLSLVNMLAEQLDGVLEVKRETGTEFILRFAS
jgi:PAS domain S-box-containing protein